MKPKKTTKAPDVQPPAPPEPPPIEIKSHFSGATLFSLKVVSLRLAVEAAVKAGADLRGANLCGAKNAELAIAQTRILPAGSIVGWKKCREGKIVQLLIPAEAKRSHAFGRKCRAEFAEVVGITTEKGKPAVMAFADFDRDFTYRVGETVRPVNGFCEDWQQECAAGIHFFICREEAVAYNL